MKRNLWIIFIISFLFIGCLTEKKGIFNFDNLPEEDLVTVYIQPTVYLHQINDVKLERPITSEWVGPAEIRLPYGLNVFHLSYANATRRSMGISTLVCELEKDNTYIIKCKLDKNNSVSYHIYKYNDKKQEEEVTTIAPLQITNFPAGCRVCEFIVVAAFPQMITENNLTLNELTLLRTKAIENGIISSNDNIKNKEKFTDFVLNELGHPELAFIFGNKSPIGAVRAGYILGISSNNETHFIMTGLNKSHIINFCKAEGPVIFTQEVYYYTK